MRSVGKARPHSSLARGRERENKGANRFTNNNTHCSSFQTCGSEPKFLGCNNLGKEISVPTIFHSTWGGGRGGTIMWALSIFHTIRHVQTKDSNSTDLNLDQRHIAIV